MRGRNRIAAVAFLLLFCVADAPGADGLFRDFQGKPRALGEFTSKGQWTIVMIWAHDCHVCNQEAAAYVDFHRRHRERDATMLGISMDGPEQKASAEAFVRRHRIDFPNLIADPETLAAWFRDLTGAQLLGTPTFLVYDPQGRLLAQEAGAVPTQLIEEFMAEHAPAAASDSPAR